MAGTITPMSKIKQILLLKKQGVSNREIADIEGMDKGTVSTYVKFIKNNSLTIDELLRKDEPELEAYLSCGQSCLY